MIDETKLNEVHGVWGPSPAVGKDGAWVRAHENDAGRIVVRVSNDGPIASLTPDGALRFASQLRRLARRIEARTPDGSS